MHLVRHSGAFPILLGQVLSRIREDQNEVTSAICQYDPETGRIGNHLTNRRCDDCKAGEENADWGQDSDQEQLAEDIDVSGKASSGARIESYFGGKRKADTDTANRIVQLALRGTVTRRRRRRSRTGAPLRGWETVEEPMTLREIAAATDSSVAYVHKVVKRIIG